MEAYAAMVDRIDQNVGRLVADRLGRSFLDADAEGRTYRDYLNPESRCSLRGYVEPAAADVAPEQSLQFERTGYFVADRFDHTPETVVFNRSVSLASVRK